MQPGTKLAFPDGTVLNADEILEPPRAGRKVGLIDGRLDRGNERNSTS